MMMRPIEVGVLGATGIIGQQLVSRLADHPWFRLAWVSASERSVGRRYGDLTWRLAQPIPPAAADLVVAAARPSCGPRVLFSALSAAPAKELEGAFAAVGHVVVSNARSYRMEPLVPLVVPEVNPDHLQLLAVQRRAHGWEGAIVTNPNCSTIVLTLALGALRAFEPVAVMVTTLQAASGAGYPGVASLDLLGNVIPVIEGEEAKMESETNKILGTLADGRVVPHPVVISAQTTRVPVVDGHTETIAVRFKDRPPLDEIRRAFECFSGRPQADKLPTAPARPVEYVEQAERPQPRLDALRGDGMTVSIGRLRACPLFDCKFVALGHNTIRGAAGAALLNAELMAVDGYLT